MMTIYPKFLKQELKKLLPATLGLCLIYFLVNLMISIFPQELKGLYGIFHNRLGHYFILGILGCSGATFMAGDNKNGITRLHLQLPWSKDEFYFNKGFAQLITICSGIVIIRNINFAFSLDIAYTNLSFLDTLFSYHLFIFSVIFSLKSKREMTALIKATVVSVAFLYFGILLMYMKESSLMIMILLYTNILMYSLIYWMRSLGKITDRRRWILVGSLFAYFCVHGLLGLDLLNLSHYMLITTGLISILYLSLPLFFIYRALRPFKSTQINKRSKTLRKGSLLSSHLFTLTTGKWKTLCGLIVVELLLLTIIKPLAFMPSIYIDMNDITVFTTYNLITITNALLLPILFILPDIEKDGIRFFMNYLPIPRYKIWISRYIFYLAIFLLITVGECFFMFSIIAGSPFKYILHFGIIGRGVSLLLLFHMALLISIFFDSHIVAVFASATLGLLLLGIIWLKVMINSSSEIVYLYYAAGGACFFLYLFYRLYSGYTFTSKRFSQRRRVLYIGSAVMAVILVGFTCISYRDLALILFG